MGGVDNNTLRIFNETALRIPRKKLGLLYTTLLQKTCSLNIVITNDSHTKNLNHTYRKKDAPANILTFKAQDTMPAEIYLGAKQVQLLADETKEGVTRQILFLVLHGMLHLRNYKHGKKMEDLEDFYAKKYM